MNKFRKNISIDFGGEHIEGNEVLTVNENVYVSYVTKNKFVVEQTCIVVKNPNLPFNSYFPLNGDFRKEMLDCNLNERKIMDVFHDNEKYQNSSKSTAETEKLLLDMVKKYPELEKLILKFK